MHIRLVTLGGMTVFVNGRERPQLRTRPVQLALLLYLALDREATRDHVAALLWPESDQEHARQALRQTVYALRHELGDDWLSSDHEVLRASPGLTADAVEVLAATDGDAAERVAELYAGGFLDGVHLVQSQPFQLWCDQWRARLERLHRRARRALIESHVRAGDPEAALADARRWLELDPLADEAEHRTVELLVQLGRKDDALREYEVFASFLAREQLQPLAETQALAAGIRSSSGSLPPLAAGIRSSGGSLPPLVAGIRPSGGSLPPPAVVPPAAGAGGRRSGWRGRIRRRKVIAGAVAAAAVATVGIFALAHARRDAPPLDPGLIVVLPFRVAGADPSIRYLREGMVDLLANKLAAPDQARRVLDPRALVSALRGWTPSEATDLPPDSALELARRLRASQLVMGEVVSAPGRIVLSAFVRHVGNGARSAAVSVNGPSDSLLPLVNRLAAGILSAREGHQPERTAYLTTESLPALRAYLEGEALFRRGRTAEAAVRFEAALDVDSTFALAAVRHYQAAFWQGDSSRQRTLAQAWRWRARLPRADSAILAAVLGPRYPRPSPVLDRIAGWRALVQRLPDSAEGWFELGELYLHSGTFVDLPDVVAQAKAAFERALALDSTASLVVIHLVDVSALAGDVAGFRRYRTMLAARGMGSGAQIAWAAYLGEPGASAALRVLSDTARTQVPGSFMVWAALGYVDPRIADVVARRRAASAIAGVRRRRAFELLHEYALNRGRTLEAPRWADSLARESADPHARERLIVEDALFWEGSASAAEASARVLEARAPDARSPEDVYLLGLWRLRRRDSRGVRAVTQRLASTGPAAPVPAREENALRAEILATRAAGVEHGADLHLRLERLDSLARAVFIDTSLGDSRIPVLASQANLTLAELRRSIGDARGALRAAGRLPLVWGDARYASSFHRERALAALALGDRTTATRAAELYLRLRSGGDPDARRSLEAFRREFAAGPQR